MDPDDPARKQIFAKLTGRLQLSDHVNLWGRYEQNLYNDFSTARGSNSVLPNVRTLVNQYLVNGDSGIEQLYIEDKRSLKQLCTHVDLRRYSRNNVRWRWRGGALLTLYATLGAWAERKCSKAAWL